MPAVTHAEERKALAEWLVSGPREVGELTLARVGEGYRLAGPARDGDPVPAPSEPQEFRRFIRQDDRGRYRPLSGERSLRGDWVLENLSLETLWVLLDVVYPLAWRHRCQERAGELRVDSGDEVLARQSGPYRQAGERSGVEVAACVDGVCARCVRHPCWHLADDPVPEEGIPCPTPCSVFIGALCKAPPVT